MSIKFFKRDSTWIAQEENDPYEVTLPIGFHKRELSGTKISVVGVNTEQNYIIREADVTRIEKNDAGDYYASVAEFVSETDVFFSGASKTVLSNPNGNDIDVQNPLPVDGDSVYMKDIDFECSDFTNWAGDETQLFQSPFSASVTNSSADNPKTITLCFSRIIKSLQIGLGENNGGNFSNVKMSLLGSGGEQRSFFDESTDDIKRTSRNAEFKNEVANSVVIEFFTDDPVSLSNIIIYKGIYTTAQIQGVDRNGQMNTVRTNIIGNLLVSLDEQKDAFGRLKVAEPFTIFDNSLTTELSDTLFWSELINGTASTNYVEIESHKGMDVLANGDYVVRQTKQRFKYQPGKSHEFFMTGLLGCESNVRKRIGLVDYDNKGLGTITNTPQNGVFFENVNNAYSWNIVKNGTVTEKVFQDDWNIDKADGNGQSGFLFDCDTTNIYTCQLEWLGVGVVVVGFAIGAGSVIYVHAFQHASIPGFVDVYMRTANLPVAYEITSLGNAGSMKAICSSVISGGGFNPIGHTNAAQNTSSVAVSNRDTELLVGIRQKEDSFEYTIEPTQLSILSTNNGNTLWTLLINPTYTNAVTWNDLDNSEVQFAENNGNEVTDNGVVIASGSFANNTDSLNEAIQTSLKIGKALDGTRDELWLAVTALGNESYYGTINFKELI